MEKKATRIITVANHKGGVGKTTTTASVGSILSSKGYKVLLIDLDPQANLTVSLLKQEPEDNVYYALTGKAESLPIVGLTDHLSIVPSSLQLATAEMELTAAISRERILAGLLSPIKDDYDFILIDCPPSLGLLTLNAFTTSTEIIIPLVAEVLPFKGLTMINRFTQQVKRSLNPDTYILGILLTRWELTNLSKQIEEGLRDELGDKVFKTKIRKNVTIAEAPLESKNILEYAPKSNGASDYLAFTDELLEKLGLVQ